MAEKKGPEVAKATKKQVENAAAEVANESGLIENPFKEEFEKANMELKYMSLLESDGFGAMYAQPRTVGSMGDVKAPLPAGVDGAKASDFGSGDKFDSLIPSLFKMPLKKRIKSERSMSFEDFLKAIDYKTHDSHLNVPGEPRRKRTGDI
jgi:hypothetical protein